MDTENVLDIGHWQHDGYTQRLTTKEWREIIKSRRDCLIYKGHSVELIAKKLGYGIVEISKQLEK